jgi:hypothetical protein
LAVTLDGIPLAQLQLMRPGASFDFSVPLPPAATGKPRVEITLEVDRTSVIPPDVRELGLAFGTIAIR